MQIDREYQPEKVEPRWAEEWLTAGLFRADPGSGRKPFCMVIPPPNVTGNLHIGHVLVYTLHDVVARWRRMQGWDVLWLPGTDHAGIATQMVVERELAKENTSRHELGREAFERRVWDWKETYGDRITGALRRLGCSVDWTRERFTLDEGLSRAVRTVFVRLYEEGLVYRDRFIVNWCPRCHTALSDLETVYDTVQGRMYTIRYPAADESGRDILVATTRPETLLGDTGVAVHPDDERYRDLVGRAVEVPLTGRSVPVVADDFVDPLFGTGAVKITPGHDPNDFEAGRRHALAELLVIDTEGRMTSEAGSYAGLDRLEARDRVVRDLEQQKLLLQTKTHEHAVGHCQRCHTMIEPLVSTQWFVKVAPLAAPAIEAVERGTTRFVPESWSKTYFEWMRNIHDWCVSRQLWWGHRIPAWYCDDCEKTIVAVDAPEACTECGGSLRRDEDVLDTWFSSALWPFSTLGWPESTADLERYYPTNLLITGHDIIFFWVARMMMMGLKFMGDVPFHEVYIHGLVRDAQGQKMSKSKGNTVDPHEVQDEFGTDALRFTMAILAAPGNDIPLARERMNGYRAFANKLWNASRFVLMKIGGRRPPAYRDEDLSLADRWILSRTQATIREVERAFSEYRFDRAADCLYHFVWHEFCDWYIEFAKTAFQAPEQAADDVRPAVDTAASVLLEVLGVLLRLLHPIMPYISEELWHKLPDNDSYLAVAEWPTTDETRIDEQAERRVELLQETIVKIRNMRAESNIEPGRKIDVVLHADRAADAELMRAQADLISTLVRAKQIELVPALDSDLIATRGVVSGLQIAIPLADVLDLEAEQARLRRDLDKVASELESRSRKLGNVSFLEKAPAQVVEKERRLQSELLERRERLERHLAGLGAEPSRGDG
jgi:valyl-tRNA synthetase